MPTRLLSRRLAPILLAAGALAALPGSAAAASPAATPSLSGGLAAEAAASTPTGGAAPGRAPSSARSRKRSRRRSARERRARREAARPVLSLFATGPRRLFLYGRPAAVAFRVKDRSKALKMRLDVLAPGRRRVLRRIDLGMRRTGVTHRYMLTGREGGHLPQGPFELRLAARDRSGHRLRRTARASGYDRLSFYWHHFPVRGNFGFGGEGSRFGAGRPGHIHQGQDIPAPEGTPALAPRGGRIKVVDYQADGAGHYVVLDGAGESRDYVFMHLRAGSIRVRRGQHVATGQTLAATGNSGDSMGAHLHFEVWEGRGGWQAGGRPVDPLPYLRNWDGWS